MAAEDKTQQKKPELSVRKKPKNYVIEDKIIKEIAQKEIASQITFEQRWSFLKAENLDKLYKQLLENDHVDMKLLREFSKYYRSRRTTDQQINFQQVPIPKLSSEMIGWRSTKPGNNLEKFGPLWAPPKPIEYPDSRFDSRNQYFIVLG